MSIKNIKIGVFNVLFLLAFNLTAQETVNIPLSNSKQAGILKMGIVRGSIKVVGYDGNEVVVTGNRRKDRHSSSRRGKSGLKKISNQSMEFEVEELDNTVRIQSSPVATIDFEIKVPKKFSLKISTVNQGSIYVENVEGAMDISNTNGGIVLKDISGSVSADALNKDIVVNFKKVTPNTAMAFSSLNGDIDVTFPKNLKADVKIKSDRGEIYTDFDLKAKPSKAKVTKGNSKKGNAYRVKVENWITGAINGGGPELLFKNFNGDVIIRSN